VLGRQGPTRSGRSADDANTFVKLREHSAVSADRAGENGLPAQKRGRTTHENEDRCIFAIHRVVRARERCVGRGGLSSRSPGPQHRSQYWQSRSDEPRRVLLRAAPARRVADHAARSLGLGPVQSLPGAVSLADPQRSRDAPVGAWHRRHPEYPGDDWWNRDCPAPSAIGERMGASSAHSARELSKNPASMGGAHEPLAESCLDGALSRGPFRTGRTRRNLLYSSPLTSSRYCLNSIVGGLSMYPPWRWQGPGGMAYRETSMPPSVRS
jgi:hypothetical protein